MEAYREIYGQTITRHDIEPIGDGPFHFDATLCGLPGLGLASSAFSPCRRLRRPQHIDGDDFVIGVGLSGGCIVDQCGREAVVAEGEAVLTNSAEPASVIVPSASRSISLRIPGAILRSRVADLDDRVSRRIPGSEALALLTGCVGVIQNDGMLAQPQLPQLVVAHVYDLACLALSAEGGTRELAEARGVREARRVAILREIDRRSGDPRLSAVTVALLLGVTPRYVHALLEETGKSFTHHLLERRLDKVATLLRDPLWGHRKVADIAAEAGFTDLSYFNRAFRRRFGSTPSAIREAERRSE